ncbi:MAG: transposase [Syntrophobacteraceae bacterium]
MSQIRRGGGKASCARLVTNREGPSGPNLTGPDLCEFCEKKRITYFIRISSNNSLKSSILPHLKRPVGRPPKGGVQVRVIEFHYQAESWDKPGRVVCKIEWHVGELFPRVGFIVTNSYLEAHKVITIYNGRAEIENRIKKGKNTLRWDKTNLAGRGDCRQSSKASRRMSRI